MNSGYIPTPGKHAKELVYQGPKVLCNITQKKNISSDCFQLKSTIMDDAATAANGSDLPSATGKFFVALKNRNTIMNMPNADIAFQLANFIDIARATPAAKKRVLPTAASP